MITARDPGFASSLREVVAGEVRQGEALSRWSTYRIGGSATVLFPSGPADVALALKHCAALGMPWFALGLGSNLLFPDVGLDALVIRLGKGLDALHQHGEHFTLGAGLPAPLAAKRTAALGYGGIHKMVGVPGSVGGGVVMNAGCHHAEWRDTVVSVLVVDRDGRDRVVPAAECRFGYRSSALNDVVVLEATVALHSADRVALEAETESLYAWRRDGTPFNQPCCGSVFKNPAPGGQPMTSGQLIEATGLKGFRVGGAEVSSLHANYFINTGGATAEDVKALMRTVRSRVDERWSVLLQPEVKLIGPAGTVIPL